MLWGDRNPCLGKHIKGVTLYRGEEGGRDGGVLLGALIWVAFSVCLPFLLCLLVIRVQPLLLFPAHTFHHHQHQDHDGQEATYRSAHDDSHRRVMLGRLCGDRAQGMSWSSLQERLGTGRVLASTAGVKAGHRAEHRAAEGVTDLW